MEVKLELIKIELLENGENQLIFEAKVRGETYQDAMILCDVYQNNDLSWRIVGNHISEQWETWVLKEFKEEITFI
jgi:hypothetical protein